MKRNKFLVLFLVFALLSLAASGIAAVEIVDSNITLEVDYSKLEDRKEVLELTTKEFTLRNTGTENETVKIAVSGLPTGYSAEGKEVEIPASNSSKVSLKVNITHEYGAGEIKIGTVTVDGVSKDLVQKTASMLKLKEVKVYIDDYHESENDLDDKNNEIKGLKPKSKVKLIFEARNLFDKSYRYGDLEEIDLYLTSDEFDVDLDESFDIDAGSSEKITFEFEVSEEVEDGDYDGEIRLIGEDEKGAEYEIKWDISLEVEREKDDVRIERLSLSKETLKCDRIGELTVKIINYGKNEQDDAGVHVYNQALGIDFSKAGIELENDPEGDNYYKTTIPIRLDKTFQAGEYPIEVKLYLDGEEMEDRGQIINLKVEDCLVGEVTKEEPESEKKEETIVVEVPKEPESEETTETTASGEGEEEILETFEETSFIEGKGIVIFMGVVSVLLVIMIILMVYVLVSGRKEKD